jgi:hypothetical protein
MWTLIVTTLVFAGSVAGGVAVNTTFLDFPDEGRCRKAEQPWTPQNGSISGAPGPGVLVSRRRRTTGSWRGAWSADVNDWVQWRS